MASLRAGHGRECITPPVGVHMAGYGARTEPSEAIRDDLYVDAVALEQGDERALILALDICSLDNEGVAVLKGAVADVTGLTPEQILVNSSHTHAGPMTNHSFYAPFEAGYFGALVLRSAQAAAQALGDLSRASLLAGAAPADIGCNRRERTPEGDIILGVNREGPRLPEVTAWVLRRSQGELGVRDIVLWSLPVHPAVMGEKNLTISSEWCGAAVRDAEADRPWMRAVFLQGCCGNQNPYREQRIYERVLQHGRTAADALGQAVDSARAVGAAPLRNLFQEADLPVGDGDKIACAMHGLRLGDVVLVAMGGEAFVEYALYGRERSTAQSTMILGYTDGSIGYLPTAVAFEEGGYEPRAFIWFRDGKSLHPSVEDTLKREIDGMLVRLMA